MTSPFMQAMTAAENVQFKATEAALAIENHRKHFGFSQKQMAAVLGLDQSHYSEIVNGKRSLSLKALRRAAAVGVPISHLLGLY